MSAHPASSLAAVLFNGGSGFGHSDDTEDENTAAIELSVSGGWKAV